MVRDHTGWIVAAVGAAAILAAGLAILALTRFAG